jgi:tetratricopeptide (TPR) repeat protein
MKQNSPKKPKKGHDSKNQDKRFDALFRRGSEMLHRGKIERALQLLERAHQLNPDHVDTAVNLSSTYILTKKFPKAVDILEPLVEKQPDQAMLWTNLGAAYLGNPILARDEEQKKAIAAFERALTIDPLAPSVAYNIGLIYRDRGEKEKAIQWFTQALQANPHDRDARALIDRLSDS